MTWERVRLPDEVLRHLRGLMAEGYTAEEAMETLERYVARVMETRLAGSPAGEGETR
jgi:hypothetical protein